MVNIELAFFILKCKFSCVVDVPKKTEQTTPVYRQWKVDDLTDDDDDDKKMKKNHLEQRKSTAFEKFIAQRPISMPPPPVVISSQHVKSSPIQDIINLTDDEDEETINKIRPEQTKTKFFRRSLTQQPRSSPPVPILSQKIDPSRIQTIIDLTDDDDDFIQSSSSLSFRRVKKLKTT